ncbi:Zinc finger X-linked protein ZXDB [Cytospora mali]|uniref:Zinc finger X-linked protein ZXDB n=1 Tax=Cytospora mali TaxID=578113 RepID=A0A194USI5_CYTMA|nr:Zinc finger X-linked protein ZXDB [Valsa mali var. pyri (nom. inval.)]
MDIFNTSEPWDTAIETIDQAQIDQVLREIEWEAQTHPTGADYAVPNTINTHYTNLPGYVAFEDHFSPPSRLESPGSMTTGSTNPSPLVPLLDYDFGFDSASAKDHTQLILPDLISYPVTMQGEWPAVGLGDAQDFDMTAFSGSTASLGSGTSLPSLLEDALQQTPPAWDALNTNYCPRYIYNTEPGPSTPAPVNPPAPSCVSESPSSTSQQKPLLACPHCPITFTDKTKLKIHTNKHTKPFRCSAAGCDYSTAEKKSLQRHLLAKSKWDEEHRIAAHNYGLRDVKYRCSREGCTYSTIREDNLKRHMTTCQ